MGGVKRGSITEEAGLPSLHPCESARTEIGDGTGSAARDTTFQSWLFNLAAVGLWGKTFSCLEIFPGYQGIYCLLLSQYPGLRLHWAPGQCGPEGSGNSLDSGLCGILANTQLYAYTGK